MAFVYDRDTRTAVDNERGLIVKYGGGGGPNDLEKQNFHLVHEDWELLREARIHEYGIYTDWTDQKDDRGLLIYHRKFDKDAHAIIQFSGGSWVKGKVEWNSEWEEIFRKGIYCQYTGAGKVNLPVHFVIPDGSKLPPPVDHLKPPIGEGRA
jgi:hypothetical protein